MPTEALYLTRHIRSHPTATANMAAIDGHTWTRRFIICRVDWFESPEGQFGAFACVSAVPWQMCYGHLFISTDKHWQ
jgi:hypothetical protein